MTTVETGRPDARPPATEVLESCRVPVEPALRAAVDSLPGPIRRIAGYHRGWWDENGVPTAGAGRQAGGKALRPALTVLAARQAGGHAEDAVPAAVAVELVHDFSLLHDDVMDHDLTRRHRPTAWTVYGVGPAILAGGSLLALALDVLAASGRTVATRATRMLAAAVQELQDGQVADLAFERRDDVRLPECLRMVERKTGALLGAACGLGALFGSGDPDRVARMERFGRELGVAFQLADDLLGIWGDPAATGKPVRSDLRSRKKSLPVVVALASGGAEARELAGLYGRDGDLSEADLLRAAELVELAGGRSWCEARADELVARALARLGTDAPATAELGTLAHLVMCRDR